MIADLPAERAAQRGARPFIVTRDVNCNFTEVHQAARSCRQLSDRLVSDRLRYASDFSGDTACLEATRLTFVGNALPGLVARHLQLKRDHALRASIDGGTPLEVRDALEHFGIPLRES
jgi:hypothetical protein